jgi:hypothetical protein
LPAKTVFWLTQTLCIILFFNNALTTRKLGLAKDQVARNLIKGNNPAVTRRNWGNQGKLRHYIACCQDRRLNKTVKAMRCGLENRSLDSCRGVRNEIIAVTERWAESVSDFLQTFRDRVPVHLQGLIPLLYLNPWKLCGHPAPKHPL